MTDSPALAPWPQGVARIVLDSTGSTNLDALQLAQTQPGPAWILTHEQVAGRGRRGREWRMPQGNFAASYLARPQRGAAEAAQLSFVAALALFDALAIACGPMARLQIKWPNDVLLNGGKAAGILLESSASGPRIDALAIGIGVNLAAAPDMGQVEPGAMRPVSVASETGLTVAPEEFLDLLAPALAARLAQYHAGGFATIREDWLRHAARLGEQITARTGRAELTGRFDGIDADGALILFTAAGRQIIPAADIFF